jgi:quercetin dioxygenase-like cupin family protein
MRFCPICFWDDDIVQLAFPDLAGVANKCSLIDGQRNFARVGACEERVKSHVRVPQALEAINAAWRPLKPLHDRVARLSRKQMYEQKTNTAALDWLPLDFAGVSMKVLHQNAATGGMTVMTRIEAGAFIPGHRHTKADETVFVVEGDFVEDGVSYGPGSFFVGRAGTDHGPHSSAGGCLLLTTFSAELDFVLA